MPLGLKAKISLESLWVIAYFFTLYVLWGIQNIFFNTLTNAYSQEIYAYLFAIFKTIIWLAPVLLYLHYVKPNKTLEYLKLSNNTIQNSLIGVLFGIVMLLPAFLNLVFNHSLNQDILKNIASTDVNMWLNAVILAGIQEEIVFRGLILQKLLESLPFTYSNLITAICFTLIHFPFWLLNGSKFEILWRSAAYIFLTGICYGYAFRATKSLWTPISAHIVHNMLLGFMS